MKIQGHAVTWQTRQHKKTKSHRRRALIPTPCRNLSWSQGPHPQNKHLQFIDIFFIIVQIFSMVGLERFSCGGNPGTVNDTTVTCAYVGKGP